MWAGPVILGLGALIGLLWLVREIRSRTNVLKGELLRLQKINQELSGRLRALQHLHLQATVWVDAKGTICAASPEAEALFGFHTHELCGLPLLKLIADVSGNQPGAQGQAHGQTEIVTKEGVTKRVEFRAVRYQVDSCWGMCLTFGESAMASRGASPERILDAMERVAGRIVSQFEGPLTAINGYTELALYQTPATNPVRRDLEEIAAAGERAAAVVRTLMAFTGNQPIPTEWVNLNALLRDLEPPILGMVNGEVAIDASAENATILASAASLREIVLVLCGGAERRMRAGDKLEIRTAVCCLAEPEPAYTGEIPPGTFVALTIADNGIPLSEETLAHLFEPLYLDRAHLGAELAAVRGIVHSFGGRIDARSAPGQGTAFEILLPFAETRRPSTEPQTEAARA